MRRRKVADWGAGALAVVVLALGGLVVVKPAVDHWDSLYRADPFVMEKASAAEQVLGKSGLLALRMILVALAAFLVAAVVQRVILGEYGLGIGRVQVSGPSAASGHKPNRKSGAVDGSEDTAVSSLNGPGVVPESSGANLAPPIAKLIASRREELGISQRELAKRAGISHTVVSRIEQGENTPSRKTLERLADALRALR